MLYAYLGSLLICCLVALSQWRYLIGNFRWLSILSVITTLVEYTGLVLMLQRQTSYPLFHAYQPVEFAFLALFLRDSLTRPLLIKTISVSIVLFGLFCLANAFLLQTWRSPNTFSFMLEAILLVIFSGFYFQHLLQEPAKKSVRDIPEFWIATGILFFFAGSFFVVGLINFFIRQDQALAMRLYTINHVLNLVFYTLYIIGLLCKVRLTKLSLR